MRDGTVVPGSTPVPGMLHSMNCRCSLADHWRGRHAPGYGRCKRPDATQEYLREPDDVPSEQAQRTSKRNEKMPVAPRLIPGS